MYIFLSRVALTNKLTFYLTHETPEEPQLGFKFYLQKLAYCIFA